MYAQTHLLILEMVKLLKIKRNDFFQSDRGVTHCENSPGGVLPNMGYIGMCGPKG